MSDQFGFRSSIVRLRFFGYVEGMTLLCLVAIAVPLKHFAGRPEYVWVLGPIHGAIFTLYLLNLWEAVAQGGWRGEEIARTVIVTLLPCGTFINDRFLARKQSNLANRDI